jgi:uncharacterized protein (TIGR03084 family)
MSVSNKDAVYQDLIAEGESVDKIVAQLEPADWDLPTPAPGWTIAHQVAHMASVCRLATAAAANPELFKKMAAGAAGDFDAAVYGMLKPYLAYAPGELLAHWRADRAAASEALSALPPDQMVPWLGQAAAGRRTGERRHHGALRTWPRYRRHCRSGP